MTGDFKEFFDPRKLSSRQVGEIAYVLSSPAYAESFKPYIDGVLRGLNALWKDRSQKRKDEYPDDFIVGGITFGEGLVKFFDMLVADTSMEEMHEALSSRPADEVYDMLRNDGRTKPVLGIDQNSEPEPLRPEEDY